MCAEALAAADVIEVLHVPGREPVLPANAAEVRVTSVSDRVMQRLSDTATAPGVVAVVRTPDITSPAPSSGPLLVLDRVADPGNVGTLLRTAAAFGAAVVSLGGADPFGPKAVRASAGACYRTSVHRPEDGADLVTLLRGAGRVVLGLAADGSRSIAEVAHGIPASGVVLVVGSEPHGLSSDLASVLDERVRIPMAPGVESLNVAAAGAIAMQALMPV